MTFCACFVTPKVLFAHSKQTHAGSPGQAMVSGAPLSPEEIVWNEDVLECFPQADSSAPIFNRVEASGGNRTGQTGHC